ncbi:MAG: S8 family serine peptidase [Bacteroidota bacterium]
MKKVVLLMIAVLMAINMSFGQSIYFKLKDAQPKAELANDRAFFSQKDLAAILKGFDVKPFLKHPEKFHSVYAEPLSRTYIIPSFRLNSAKTRTLINQLENLAGIEYVETVGEAAFLSCPTNDPSDANWNLSRHEITCVQEAHCLTSGDPNISIAIMDNGYMPGHPELAGQVAYAEPGAYNGACHGTQSAITAAGATDNGYGISSSGYDCSLMLYRYEPSTDFYPKMIDAAERGARIINNSYRTCGFNNTQQMTVSMLADMGVIVVGSAANGPDGTSCGDGHDYAYPASYDKVISVSSVSGNLCCETTYNFWNPTVPYDPPLTHTHNDAVDVLAQGYAVVTGSCSGNGQDMSYGTSVAGPHIAGIIGLMLSVNPCLDHDDVLSILQSTGQDVSGVCNNASYYPNGVPPVPCAESAVQAAASYVGPTLVVSADTDWDQKFVSGNVIIKSGTTLTIHGVVSMATNSRIIVEKDADLIIDGGVLTSCHQQWKGIVVEGDGASGSQAQAGRVRLQNNAIIENAKNAISMNPTHLGWPVVSQHWGGLVEAENATIRNCRRGVAFMKYATGFIQDQSYFSNCTFENIETSAVTIWSNNHVTFQECTFDNIVERGIYAYDSEVIVNNQCVFTNQHTGVDILTTYPIPFASQIGDHDTAPNDFDCSNYGVFTQAQSNIEPLLITNNNFLGGLYGVHLNGLSNYQISHNDMVGGFAGVEAVATGNANDPHSNIVSHNNISSMTYGSHAAFNNENLEFLSNCFDFNGLSDIYVSSGSIFIDQGNADLANGNCFTKGGVPEIDNSNNDDNINLWVWVDEPSSSCEYPTLVANDPDYKVTIKDAVGKLLANCGTSSSPGPINVRTFCRSSSETQADLLAKIEEIEQALTEIENDTQLSQAYKNYLIKIYKRCLYYLQVKVINVILKPELDDPDRLSDTNQRIEEAISYASSLPLFDQQILAYGLMVSSEQNLRARQYVNGLAANNASEANFITAQNINLDYLQDVENYTLSPQNENFLFNTGRGGEPLDGYARSIYEVITGDRIRLELPEPRNSPRARSLTQEKGVDGSNYKVYPNPASTGNITVVIEGGFQDLEYTVNMTDVHGRLCSTATFTGSTIKMNTADLQNGMYLLTILNDKGEVTHVEKIMIVQ